MQVYLTNRLRRGAQNAVFMLDDAGRAAVYEDGWGLEIRLRPLEFPRCRSLARFDDNVRERRQLVEDFGMGMLTAIDII